MPSMTRTPIWLQRLFVSEQVVSMTLKTFLVCLISWSTCEFKISTGQRPERSYSELYQAFHGQLEAPFSPRQN